MKKIQVLCSLCLCTLVMNLTAQVMLRDTFVAVSSAPLTNAAEYLIGTGLTNAPNAAVYGGSVVGFTTNHLWYGNTDLLKPQAGSLNYTNGVGRDYVAAGGRLILDLAGEDDSVREVARQIAGINPQDPWYFSALIKATEDTNGTAVVRFDDIDGFPGHSPYMWGVGFGFIDGGIKLITRSGSNSRVTNTVVNSYVAGETYLIVVKVDVDTGVGSQYNDTVSVWVNPTGLLPSEAGEPDFTLEVNTITSNLNLLIDELRFYTSGFGGGTVEFDEVHIGTDWSDVVPSISQTELILYDNFDTVEGQYVTTSELNGQNPNVPGFVGPWRDSTSSYWRPNDENLVYSYKTHGLVSSGGSAQATMPTHYDRHIRRFTDSVADSVLYISSLMSFNVNHDGNDFAYAAFFDADDTAYGAGIQWGIFNSQTAVRCRYASGDNNHIFVVGDGSFVNDQTYLYVIKMEKDVSSYWDRVTVYLNPEDLSQEAGNTEDLNVLAANLVGPTVLDEIYLRSFNVTNGLFKVDEIRVGTTWEQVVPYQIVPYSPPGTIIMIQ